MAAESMPADKTELAIKLRTRGLISTVVDSESWRRDDSQPQLIEELATILNATGAPPPDLYMEEALAELDGPRFFLVQNILCKLIPLLEIDQEVLLAFVVRLIEAGGIDLAAGAPSIAFGEWTKKHPIRAARIYKSARAHDNLAIRQLFTVLRMNADIEEALEFAQAQDREAKLAAISALGAMDLGIHYDNVLNTLLQQASSNDEETAIRSLGAGYRAAERRSASAPDGFDEQLARVLESRSASAIHFAADLLWLHGASLSANAIDLCLNAVADVNAGNTGTISLINNATYKLVNTERRKHVIRLICSLIDRSEGQITIDAFQSTFYALKNAGTYVLGDAVVYWLLNGGTSTRKCVSSKICSVSSDEPPFTVSRSSIPLAPSDQLFLCRKAIGWFFIDPLAAVTIPLAVLRDGSKDIAHQVLDLIYDPLLLSYGSKLKAYLERYVADGNANASGVGELLARKAALHAAMEGIEKLVELHPSETQREAERVLWDEQMKEGMELARRRSIFDGLVTKQYILYGGSSLTPVYSDDGNPHLTEIEMKSFSISSELPLLSIVDPVGLEHMLLQFKLESRKP